MRRSNEDESQVLVYAEPEEDDDGKADSETTALVGEPQDPVIEPSSHRFIVIGLFVLVSCLGGFSIDLVQAAESSAVAAYPGLSVSTLSTIQLATQIPGMLSEPKLLKSLGMRNLVILMAGINFVGYQFIGGIPLYLTNTDKMGLYVGNALVGFTAGVLLIPVAKLVSDWMPDRERSIALSLCLNAGNIGTGAGYYLSEAIAGSRHLNPANVPQEHVDQMHTYLNMLSIAPGVALLLCGLFMENLPQLAPSKTEHDQRVLKASLPQLRVLASLYRPWQHWYEDLGQLGPSGFMISIIGFTASTIAIYTTSTFLPAIMLTQGVSPASVAVIGASWFLLNVVGATFITPLLALCCSQYKAMLALLGGIAVLQILSFFVVYFSCGATTFIVLMLATATIAAPAQAVTCDFGCNTMYPIEENVIMFWQMVFGMGSTASFNMLFATTEHWSTPVPYAFGFLLQAAVSVTAVLLCFAWRGSYKRDDGAQSLRSSSAEEVTIDSAPSGTKIHNRLRSGSLPREESD